MCVFPNICIGLIFLFDLASTVHLLRENIQLIIFMFGPGARAQVQTNLSYRRVFKKLFTTFDVRSTSKHHKYEVNLTKYVYTFFERILKFSKEKQLFFFQKYSPIILNA